MPFINKHIIKEFLNFNSKYQFLLFFFSLIFIFLKWSDLSVPIWHDETSYVPAFLWEIKGSFFLPWNYRPDWLMGHPFLHSFILWIAFSVFGPSVFIAKAVSLFLSLFFLVALYKMTEVVFKSSITAFYSVIFVMFLPLFLIHSSLILADISAMAFGFVSIYAFIAKKYKSLIFFSLCLGAIRESSLAFFVPIILYALLIPSHRKLLFYLLPGLFLFISHFLIYFLKTGSWIAHPYVSGILLHNPNPDFFNFSVIFGNTKGYFFNLVKDVFPYLFLILASVSIVLYIFLCLIKKQKRIFRKELLIPLGMCFLWFSFWIMYPEHTARNYFPLLMFIVPLGNYFIVKVIPFYHIFLTAICGFLIFQSVYLKSYSKIPTTYNQYDILNAKKFTSYFEKYYGEKIRISGHKIFSTWPENTLMSFAGYEYVKIPMRATTNCQIDYIKKYKAVIFRDIWQNCLSFYLAVNASPVFVKVETPIKDYELFLHKDLLN